MTPTEFNPIDAALEQAVKEIRDGQVDPAVIEAAAARVWTRLAAEAGIPGAHLRTCADFQALIPDYRAGKLPAARAILLKDHLHECVACRKVYEGRVVTMPLAQAPRRSNYTVRWAAAAVIVAAAGISIWIAVEQSGGRSGRAIVQSVNGTLYEISAEGIKALAAGEDLPDGVEIRTAQDSSAMLQLRDGSTVEVRERSGLSTLAAADDITVRLSRGSIIVQAAKRKKGHLYVSTVDCQVAVTGTVFSVSAGVKGSRVSVMQGEVHVSQNNQDQILRPGQQAVTSAMLEPLAVQDDIAWSRDRQRLVQLVAQFHAPAPRYDTRLVKRLPANTVLVATIPNLGPYLNQAQSIISGRIAENPEMRSMWGPRSAAIDGVLQRMRAANEYLGDELVIALFAGPNGSIVGPAFLAETRREGFPEFLRKMDPNFSVEARQGLVAFGPVKSAVDTLAASLDTPAGGFAGTPFYARIAEAYKDGAGLLLCGDLSALGQNHSVPGGARYFIAAQKEVNNQMESRAAIGFEGPRSGIASWLADPAPMGSLDYVSPEAQFVAAFVVKNPAVIVDEVLSLYQRSGIADAQKSIADAGQEAGVDIRKDLAASLGGEFSVSFDGPIFPPSWKLVSEAYDPARVQGTLKKLIDSYNQHAAASGKQALRTSEEQFEGRTYYMVAGADPNPLTEAHYTFADGYLIAGPTRALVSRALQQKATGTSITHSSQFLALEPRDHYNNFSGLIYQNLGATLKPLVGLLGSLAPSGGGPGQQNMINSLGDMKPMMIAAYNEPDRIAFAGSGNVLAAGMSGMISGNLFGMVGNALPFSRLQGTRVH